MSDIKGQVLRDLPSVSAFLESDEGRQLCNDHNPEMVKFLLRDQLDGIRNAVLSSKLAGRTRRDAQRR